MTTLANREFLKQVYQAFNAREVETVLASMQADVDWPNVIENCRVVGRDNIREYWRRQFETLDPRVEPIGFADEGERTVVDVHQVVQDLSGKVLVDQIVRHVYSFRDGLIERMEIREVS